MPSSTKEHVAGLGKGRVRGKATRADLREKSNKPWCQVGLRKQRGDRPGSAAWVEREQVAYVALGSHGECLLSGERAA